MVVGDVRCLGANDIQCRLQEARTSCKHLFLMLIAIPTDTFARRYGEYLYLFNQRNWASALIRMPKYFDPLFDRHTTDIDIVAKTISRDTGVAAVEIRRDIINLVYPLMHDGYLVSGETAEVVGSSKTYRGFYAVSAPKPPSVTENGGVFSRRNTIPEAAERGTDALMQYFMSHPTPFELCIDLTRNCTARCVHCYVPGFEHVSLPPEMAKKAMREFRAMGGLKVKFTGGECMLHKDFVEILEEARMNDLVISVLSNLSVCGKNEIEAMKRCNVALVQCSLYGADAVTHEAVTRRPTFDATISAIYRLREAGIPVRIHCPVMKQNISGIDKVLEFGEKLGIRVSLDASIMSRADHDSTNQQCELGDSQLLEYLRRYENVISYGDCEYPCVKTEDSVCEIGTSKICLSASGEYYPCNGCYDYKLGNCQSTLMEVWNDEPVRRIRSLKWKDMQTCVNCKDLNYCYVCPSRNFNATGDFTKPDPALCRLAKTRHSVAMENVTC